MGEKKKVTFLKVKVSGSWKRRVKQTRLLVYRMLSWDDSIQLMVKQCLKQSYMWVGCCFSWKRMIPCISKKRIIKWCSGEMREFAFLKDKWSLRQVIFLLREADLVSPGHFYWHKVCLPWWLRVCLRLQAEILIYFSRGQCILWQPNCHSNTQWEMTQGQQPLNS